MIFWPNTSDRPLRRAACAVVIAAIALGPAACGRPAPPSASSPVASPAPAPMATVGTVVPGRPLVKRAFSPDAPPGPERAAQRVHFGYGCARPWDCVEDYEDFLLRARPYSQPITRDEMMQWVRDGWEGRIPYLPGPMEPEELRARIADALAVPFLLDGFDARPLYAYLVEESAGPGYTQQDIRIEDPWIGRFRALLLLPTDPPRPLRAIVAVHGHGEVSENFRDDHNGVVYAQAGFAVLMPEMRINMGDPRETALSRKFLRHGFALASMRVYEMMLCLKYLRGRPDIDPDRVGLMGHSGGSGNGNVAIRLEPRFAAFVTDCNHEFYWDPKRDFLDTVVPMLLPLHDVILDFSTAQMPVKQVMYDYSDGPDEVIRFFDENL